MCQSDKIYHLGFSGLNYGKFGYDILVTYDSENPAEGEGLLRKINVGFSTNFGYDDIRTESEKNISSKAVICSGNLFIKPKKTI